MELNANTRIAMINLNTYVGHINLTNQSSTAVAVQGDSLVPAGDNNTMNSYGITKICTSFVQNTIKNTNFKATVAPPRVRKEPITLPNSLGDLGIFNTLYSEGLIAVNPNQTAIAKFGLYEVMVDTVYLYYHGPVVLKGDRWSKKDVPKDKPKPKDFTGLRFDIDQIDTIYQFAEADVQLSEHYTRRISVTAGVKGNARVRLRLELPKVFSSNNLKGLSQAEWHEFVDIANRELAQLFASPIDIRDFMFGRLDLAKCFISETAAANFRAYLDDYPAEHYTGITRYKNSVSIHNDSWGLILYNKRTQLFQAAAVDAKQLPENTWRLELRLMKSTTVQQYLGIGTVADLLTCSHQDLLDKYVRGVTKVIKKISSTPEGQEASNAPAKPYAKKFHTLLCQALAEKHLSEANGDYNLALQSLGKAIEELGIRRPDRQVKTMIPYLKDMRSRKYNLSRENTSSMVAVGQELLAAITCTPAEATHGERHKIQPKVIPPKEKWVRPLFNVLQNQQWLN